MFCAYWSLQNMTILYTQTSFEFQCEFAKKGDWPTGEEFGRNGEGIAHCENACAYILHVPKFHN